MYNFFSIQVEHLQILKLHKQERERLESKLAEQVYRNKVLQQQIDHQKLKHNMPMSAKKLSSAELVKRVLRKAPTTVLEYLEKRDTKKPTILDEAQRLGYLRIQETPEPSPTFPEILLSTYQRLKSEALVVAPKQGGPQQVTQAPPQQTTTLRLPIVDAPQVVPPQMISPQQDPRMRPRFVRILPRPAEAAQPPVFVLPPLTQWTKYVFQNGQIIQQPVTQINKEN